MWEGKKIFSGTFYFILVALIRGLKEAASSHHVPLKRKDSRLLNSKIIIKQYYFSSVRLLIHEAAAIYQGTVTFKVLDLIYG